MHTSFSHLDLVFKEVASIAGSLSHKKKYQTIRDAIQGFHTYLDHNKKQNPLQIPLSEIEKLLRPAIHYRSAKFHITLISFLLKMINLRVISNIDTFKEVIDYFLAIKVIQKDTLQVKLHQSFINLIQPDYIHFGNFQFVEKCLTMVLFMKTSRLPIIALSADTVLQKIIEILSLSTQLIVGGENDSSFDKMELQVELGDQSVVTTEPPVTVSGRQQSNLHVSKEQELYNLQKLLQDLILIVDFKRPNWYLQAVPVDREFGLSSMNCFIQNMGRFFLTYTAITSLLRQTFIPVLRRLLQTPTNMIKQAIIVECFKCMVRMLEVAPLIFVELWEVVDSFLRSADHSMHKNLALQTIIHFVQQQVFLEGLIDDHQPFFFECFSFVSALAKDIVVVEGEGKKWSDLVNPVKNLQHPSNDECLPSDGALLLRMLSEFHLRFANSLCVQAERYGIQLGRINKPHPEFQAIIERVWKIALRCLRNLLIKELEEGVTQNTLNTFQAYVNITGSVHMKTAQDAFIKVICEYCLPRQGQVEFTKRHIQINKMVLNIGNCLGNLLECSCWISIFKTFQECENFYQRNRLARDTSQEEQIKTQDITILFLQLESLFTHSGAYENEHLLLIMDALNQITIEQLESNELTSTTGVPSPTKKFDQRTKVFSLQKLLEVIKANLFRLDLFWEHIMAHFICVVSSKNVPFIQNTGETFCQIIFLAFDYLLAYMKKQEGANFVKEKWQEKDGMYQHTLLQPLVDLCALRSSELKEIILSSLLRLLQNNGHELQRGGWDQVLQTLSEISGEQTFIYVKQGLQATECIIAQFLHMLSVAQLEQLFDVIENFKQNSSEQNINFQICNMLWHVGDFLNQSSVAHHALFMTRIFGRLSGIAMDPVPEIRHSAIHIFCNLLLFLNPENNTHTDWRRILETIYFDMIQRIVVQFQEKRVANESDYPLWEETTKSILQSSLKLFKKYLAQVDDAPYILAQFVPLAIQAMSQNKSEVLLESVRVLKELFQCKPRDALLECASFQLLLAYFDRLFTTPPVDVKLLKTIILKVIPEVLELLNEAFKVSVQMEEVQDSTVAMMFIIYEKILLFPLVADMSFNLVQHKIFYDETYAILQLKVQSELLHLMSAPQQQNYFTMCRTILHIQPTNKCHNALLTKFIAHLATLIKSLTVEDLYLQLLVELCQLIKALRGNHSYIHFHQTFGGQSLQAQTALALLDIVRLNTTKKKVLLPMLHDVIPLSYGDLMVANLKETIHIQQVYLDYLCEVYLEQQHEDLFEAFLAIVHALAITEHSEHLVGETPLKVLTQMMSSQHVAKVLPYFLAVSDFLLSSVNVADKQQPTPKLVASLLLNLQLIKIPTHSFRSYRPLLHASIEYASESPIQSDVGHLVYLMPHLSRLILSHDYDTRKQLSTLLQSISAQFTKN